jgi:hypothetical protein
MESSGEFETDVSFQELIQQEDSLGPIRDFDSNPDFRGTLTPRQSFRQGRLLLVSLLEVSHLTIH